MTKNQHEPWEKVACLFEFYDPWWEGDPIYGVTVCDPNKVDSLIKGRSRRFGTVPKVKKATKLMGSEAKMLREEFSRWGTVPKVGSPPLGSRVLSLSELNYLKFLFDLASGVDLTQEVV